MEEQHDQEEEYVEEQSVPLQSKPITINKKTGLPRKVLDEAALSKLAKAREKANAIREENRLKKLEQKVKDMKIKKNIKEEVKENELKEEVKENELKEEPEEPEEEEPPKIIKKKIKKKKPVVIVEQSSDDEDEFEANDKVLFVKRVSRKKKEKEPEAPRSEPTQEYELPPPDIPKPPIRQKPTLLEQQYNAMFSGQFLNNQRRRF